MTVCKSPSKAGARYAKMPTKSIISFNIISFNIIFNTLCLTRSRFSTFLTRHRFSDVLSTSLASTTIHLDKPLLSFQKSLTTGSNACRRMLISLATVELKFFLFREALFCRCKSWSARSVPLTPRLEWQAERRSFLFFLLRSATAFRAVVSRARGRGTFMHVQYEVSSRRKGRRSKRLTK
jgi:hypothetical protein